jgi:hypothetical protein
MSKLITLKNGHEVKGFENQLQSGVVAKSVTEGIVTVGLIDVARPISSTQYSIECFARVMATGDRLLLRNELDDTATLSIISLEIDQDYGPYRKRLNVTLDDVPPILSGESDIWHVQAFRIGLPSNIEPMGIIDGITSSISYTILLLGEQQFSTGDNVHFLSSTGSTGTVNITGVSFIGPVDNMSDQYSITISSPQTLGVGISAIWKEVGISLTQDVFTTRQNINTNGLPQVIRMQS